MLFFKTDTFNNTAHNLYLKSVRILILLALFFSLIPEFCIAQEWGAWEQLYSDKDITVDVRFKIQENNCNDTRNLISYRVNGNLNSFADYIVWATDYIDCRGVLVYQEHSLDISIGNTNSNGSQKAYGDTWIYPTDEFYAKTVITKFHSVKRSPTPSYNLAPQVPKKSTAAISIEGDDDAFYDLPINLTVKGGQLGSGANWVWYENRCGGKQIGVGNSLEIRSLANTTYYVRAEGIGDTTKCVQKTIHVKSKAPDYVSGGGDIKLDNPAILKIVGGSLAPGCTWVWYENSCEGTKIGEGSSLTVSPKNSTTYYVKAEGKNGTTECSKVKVSILSRDPVSIVGNQTIEIGRSAKLSIIGGYLGENDNWVWYENTCGGKKISTGDEITVTPIESVTYYVRGEGKNPNTSCASLTVNAMIPYTSSQQNSTPYIDDINFRVVRGKVKVIYKIKNSKPSDLYNITIKGFRNSGELNLSSAYGAIDNIRGKGRKKIQWNSQKDGYALDEKVVFNISGTVKETIPLIPRLTKSLIFPGWGDVHLRNKNSRLVYGILGYALAASSVFFNQQANKNYNLYRSTSDIGQRNQLYNETVTENYISIACAGTAGLFWTIDFAGVISKRHKVKNDLESSDYYYQRSQSTLNAFSNAEIISTKSE